MRTAKALLILVSLVGVFVRVLNTDVDVRHLGDLLIATPILTHLLLYVRGLRPSHSLTKRRDSAVLNVSSAINTPQAN